MRQFTTQVKIFVFILLSLWLSPNKILAQLTLEATYPTTDLRRIHLPVSGEKWFYADDSTRKIYLFNANHTPWKTVNYPSEPNKTVSLDAMNMPVSETTFNRDTLLEFVWRFKDSTTYRERVRILNERNDSIYVFAEGRNLLTVNELAGSSTKLFVENRDFYDNYKTFIFSSPNMLLEKIYDKASNMHRQRFGHAGEKYYFKNVPQKYILIYNPNHSIWASIPLPVPTNGGSTYNNDPVFFADDKIFDADTLVEFAFSYDIGLGYGLSKIVSENGREIQKANSISSFVVDKKVGQPNKLFFTYNASINTVNTNYNVIGLPSGTLEKTYFSPVERILLKEHGVKYTNIEYGVVKMFNIDHSFWRSVNLVSNSGYYFGNNTPESLPFISDSIVNPDGIMEVIWNEWKQTSRTTSAYQLRIITENGLNLATIPKARFFQVSQMDNLETKLITKTWDSTRYTETKVWRFSTRTPVSDPSVQTAFDATISPNPFSNSFSINVLAHERPLSIRLFNAIGVLVFAEKMTTSNATFTPPNGLPQGVYWCQISDGKSQIVKKLVKMN